MVTGIARGLTEKIHDVGGAMNFLDKIAEGTKAGLGKLNESLKPGNISTKILSPKEEGNKVNPPINFNEFQKGADEVAKVVQSMYDVEVVLQDALGLEKVAENIEDSPLIQTLLKVADAIQPAKLPSMTLGKIEEQAQKQEVPNPPQVGQNAGKKKKGSMNKLDLLLEKLAQPETFTIGTPEKKTPAVQDSKLYKPTIGAGAVVKGVIGSLASPKNPNEPESFGVETAESKAFEKQKADANALAKYLTPSVPPAVPPVNAIKKPEEVQNVGVDPNKTQTPEEQQTFKTQAKTGSLDVIAKMLKEAKK